MIDLERTARKYVTVAEFCEYFVVAERTAYNWIAQGLLPAADVFGSKRIPIDAMRAIDITCHVGTPLSEAMISERLQILQSVPRRA